MDFLNIEDNENRENNLPQNQEERDSLFWSRFHQENPSVVYGAWYMYTPKTKENPKTAEEELSIVLDKMASQIKYNASKSIFLKEEDYASFVAEWVMDRISKYGVENGNEINGFTMSLVQDMNRYRSKQGYYDAIPDHFFSDFNKVYNFIESNSFLTRKDIEHLVRNMDLKYKTKNRERDVETFLGYVESALFNDNKRLMVLRSDKTVTEDCYSSCFAIIKNYTNNKYKDSSIKNFIEKFLSGERVDYVNKTDYDIRFTLMANPKLSNEFKDYINSDFLYAKFPNQEEAAEFFLDVILNQKIDKYSVDELAKNIYAMGLKSTSAEIESLKMNYEKSLLYKQICRQGNKIMKSLKKEKPFPDVKNMIASVNHVGQRNINNKGMEQEIIAYRGTRDIDVIVKDSVNNKYYFVSGTSFDKFNRGGNLLLHEKYIEIKPDIINTLPSSAILNNQNEKLENEQECCEDDYEYEL